MVQTDGYVVADVNLLAYFLEGISWVVNIKIWLYIGKDEERLWGSVRYGSYQLSS